MAAYLSFIKQGNICQAHDVQAIRLIWCAGPAPFQRRQNIDLLCRL